MAGYNLLDKFRHASRLAVLLQYYRQTIVTVIYPPHTPMSFVVISCRIQAASPVEAGCNPR